MVANPAKLDSQTKQLGHVYEGVRKTLVPLKFDKEIGRSKNQVSWDEKLRHALATAHLTLFLHEGSSFQAPKSKALELLILRQIDEYVEEMRDNRKKYIATKKEEESKLALEEAEFEAHIEKRKQEMLDKAKASHKAAEKRGVRAETIFLNPVSQIPAAKAYLNPNANIEVEIGEESFLFEAESDQMSYKRHFAWLLLTTSIKEVDEALWKHIPVGDVSGLYSLINTNFMNVNRVDVVADLNKRLNNFKKKENETFLAYKTRFESLMAEMAEFNLEIDKDVLRSALTLSLEESDNMTKEAYMNCVSKHGEIPSCEEIFAKMEPLMKIAEKIAAEKKEKEFHKVQNKKKKKEEKKAQALRASASSSFDNSKPNWLGVCYFHHTEKGCRNGKSCSFKHQKLNKRDLDCLKEHMDKINKKKSKSDEKEEKNPPPRRSMLAKTSTSVVGRPSYSEVASRSSSPKSSSSTLVDKATSSMTDKQVEIFARTLADEASREENK